MNERPVQYFSDEYLERIKELTPDQIAEFLDQFRLLFADRVGKNQNTPPNDK